MRCPGRWLCRARLAFCLVRNRTENAQTPRRFLFPHKRKPLWGVSGFDAKRLAGIDTATEVRGSDKRSPGGGTPDPIAGRRKAASKGCVAIWQFVNRDAPVWLARLSRLPWQAGAARFDACQIEQKVKSGAGTWRAIASQSEPL